MGIAKPLKEKTPAYAWSYTNKLEQDDLIQALVDTLEQTSLVVGALPAEKEDYAYAEGKWTVKQLLEHILDTERILAYRALRFSRRDDTPLEGFDEDNYAKYSNAANRSLAAVLQEYIAVRTSTILLYKSMTEEMLDFYASANGQQHCARTLGWFLAGHNFHHLNVLKERY